MAGWAASTAEFSGTGRAKCQSATAPDSLGQSTARACGQRRRNRPGVTAEEKLDDDLDNWTILRRVSADSADEVAHCDNYMSAMDQLLLHGEGHFCETPEGEWIHAITFKREVPSEQKRATLFRSVRKAR